MELVLVYIFFYLFVHFIGARPEDGVPDMTVISEIDEFGINTNLKTRYRHNKIYVSLHSYWSQQLYELFFSRLTLVQF